MLHDCASTILLEIRLNASQCQLLCPVLSVTNLLKLSRVSFFSSLADNSDPIQAYSFAISITIHYEKYKACDILEFDES